MLCQPGKIIAGETLIYAPGKIWWSTDGVMEILSAKTITVAFFINLFKYLCT